MEVDVNPVRPELEAYPDGAYRLLTALLDATVDGIVVTDACGRIDTFNPAAERLLGYRAEEVVGRDISLLVRAPHRDADDRCPAHCVSTSDSRIIDVKGEVRGRRKDGTEFPLRVAVDEAWPGGERKFTVILHDLSAGVRLAEQVRQREALAALGEMAAVMAHEVRNPLAGIRGAIQILGGRLPADSHDAPILGEIIKRIDALNGLVQDVLLFARPPRPRPELVELEPLVRTTVALLKGDPTVKDMRVDVDASAALIVADPELLKSVFLNLLVNAAHAMHGQGVVRVLIQCDRAVCRIVFIDDGPGIPAEILGKVFTPFFTTKARGAGIGLPTAKRLIDAHGGTISVASAPAGGTAVTVQLPLAARPAASTRCRSEA
jgi:PAS domain S-box-containing protein